MISSQLPTTIIHNTDDPICPKKSSLHRNHTLTTSENRQLTRKNNQPWKQPEPRKQPNNPGKQPYNTGRQPESRKQPYNPGKQPNKPQTPQ